jgi:hypothetical protein
MENKWEDINQVLVNNSFELKYNEQETSTRATQGLIDMMNGAWEKLQDDKNKLLSYEPIYDFNYQSKIFKIRVEYNPIIDVCKIIDENNIVLSELEGSNLNKSTLYDALKICVEHNENILNSLLHELRCDINYCRVDGENNTEIENAFNTLFKIQKLINFNKNNINESNN